MRVVIGCSVSLSEAEVHWRRLLESLTERGMRGVALITSDDHYCLRGAIKAVLPAVRWQRCQVHLQRNATAYVPKIEMRKNVAADKLSSWRTTRLAHHKKV